MCVQRLPETLAWRVMVLGDEVFWATIKYRFWRNAPHGLPVRSGPGPSGRLFLGCRFVTQTQFYLLLTPIILFSLTIHEYSHGRTAFLLGDNTAKLMGRLSFNPLRHLDLMGTLCIYFLGFGWAKPVPVDGRNLRDPQRDMMFVALAGPAANLLLAVLFGFLVRMMYLHIEQYPFLFVFLCFGVYINSALAVFNMLPIFPLDGSSVLKGLVSRKAAIRLSQWDRYSGIILLVVFLVDHFAKTGILIRILSIPISFVVKFMTQEAFPALKIIIPFL